MRLLSVAAVLPFALSTLVAVGASSSRALASTPFCLGDGTGSNCPCLNNGAAGNGCANSVFAVGGALTDAGVPSCTNGSDFLVLTASNVTGPGLFFQSTGTLFVPITFGDGLRCTTGTIVRIAVAFPTAGVATYPTGLQPEIHIPGGTVANNTYGYQFWYRDGGAFCTGNFFNVTNGLTITWQA